jgi:hypothetical protein
LQITCFSSTLADYFFVSILELPCLIHSLLPFSLPSWNAFRIHPRITVSHPFWITLFSSIQDCPVSSIDPWGGGLVGLPLMTVSWKSSGHMVVTVWKWIFCREVVFVREWKSRYNLVEIRL